MPLTEERLRHLAIQKGIKESKKRNQLLTSSEVAGLKIQTIRPYVRIAFGSIGLLLIASAWIGWPTLSNIAHVMEWIGGILFLCFGIFGIRRTLSHAADGSVDFLVSVVDAISDAVS
jgi:putative Mn2+ efflux pump MntP